MIRIIGAGMAGLIANVMLRTEGPIVSDQSDSVPNNHHALLRFRSSVVGDAVGIPFKKVHVIKAVHQPTNAVADSLSYSLKVTGRATLRSIISASGQIEERYIAPPDLIPRLASQLGEARFGESASETISKGGAIISTIPMPSLMDLLGYTRPEEFVYRQGWAINAELDPDVVDAYATLYYPRANESGLYRASITGSTLIIEGVGEVMDMSYDDDLLMGSSVNVLEHFGIIHPNVVIGAKFHQQKYSKILPISDQARKRFMLWATENHNIYSLGRFATWRPGLLLDDLVQDIRIIQRMINGDLSSSYNARK